MSTDSFENVSKNSSTNIGKFEARTIVSKLL